MLKISLDEHRRRQQLIRAELEKRNLHGACFFGNNTIFYLTGFNFSSTERPMALVMNTTESVMFVPELEKEHCLIDTAVDRAVSYPEYPGEIHPMYQLQDLFAAMKLDNKAIGADGAGYPAVNGYRGPRLQELMPQLRLDYLTDYIVEMRMIKSPAELALIRESARWGDLAHQLLQRYTSPGKSEIQVSMQASMEATQQMIETLGERYVAMGGRGVGAGYRGQIGAHSALPHSMTINATFQAGDTLVTGAGGNIGGYRSELERTMFVGLPSEKQQYYFNLMKEAQEIAFGAIKPGDPYSVVDTEVRRFFDKHNLWEYWRHHQGHSIGLEGHEAPFFDIGDDSLMQPGMVVCVEPGIYVPGLGGFRHSDTGVITERGFEIITNYPRDWASLICQ